MTTETLRGTVAARRSAPISWARVRPLVIHFVLAASALVMLYPVIWMVVSSLRPGNEIFRDPGILVKDLRIENYRVGWNALTEPFTRYLLNSALVVFGAILGNLVSCSMAAYAFARLEFSGKKFWFAIMLLSIMLPIHVVIVPVGSRTEMAGSSGSDTPRDRYRRARCRSCRWLPGVPSTNRPARRRKHRSTAGSSV